MPEVYIRTKLHCKLYNGCLEEHLCMATSKEADRGADLRTLCVFFPVLPFVLHLCVSHSMFVPCSAFVLRSCLWLFRCFVSAVDRLIKPVGSETTIATNGEYSRQC